MTNETNSYPRPKSAGLVLMLISLILAGTAGGLTTVSVLKNSPDARRLLGLDSLSNGNTSSQSRQERVVVEESSAFIDTVKDVSPAVVSILATRNIRDFFGNVVEQEGGGTGFIVYNNGYIVTNKHVVEAPADYTVMTSDGKDYSAKVLAIDPILDLAVLKIEATGLPVIKLGNSDDLQIGQWVIAIGNALGEFQNTVTVGVVSAKDRQVTAGGGYSGVERLDGLIQTDAAINPGNSGGPLMNLAGQVVGINTAVAGDAQNIGFAIPINVAKAAIESVLNTGKIVRPMLGVRYLPITKELARLESLPVENGALIVRGNQAGELAVVSGSPADKAGLVEGDIILALNNEEITERNPLTRLLQQYKIDDEIEIKYLHKGEEKNAKVKLVELK